MNTLFRISKDFEDLASLIESSDELNAAIASKFEKIRDKEHPEIVQYYIDFIDGMRANSAFYSLKAEMAKQKAKHAEIMEKKFTERMKLCIEQNPNLPWKGISGNKVSLRNNPQSLELKGFTTFTRSFTNVIDFTDVEIDPKFIDIVNLNCLNTDRVKNHLKNVGELPWAHLKTDKHIRIY